MEVSWGTEPTSELTAGDESAGDSTTADGREGTRSFGFALIEGVVGLAVGMGRLGV